MEFNSEHEAAMHDIMQHIPGAVPGKMFGMPCYKVNGKLAVGLFENGIVLKVGESKTNELIQSGSAEPFEPMAGRRWKEWVLLTGDFDQHRDLFELAVDVAQRAG
ncbi:MAG: DUF1801 domain-containing protein [Anaerolineae bacterium]|nr:DUF1801 domain-containing protein [Anaerolineae bacterium]